MNLADLDTEGFAGGKVVRTFRMPRELLDPLGREAHRRGLDLTALVLRILHGYLTYFSLPEAAIAQLEADREALKMDRHHYLSHVLYHRCLTLRQHGAGFDDPCMVSSCSATSAQRPEQETLPKGARGGGAHAAAEGLVPGAGIWPFGVQENPPSSD